VTTALLAEADKAAGPVAADGERDADGDTVGAADLCAVGLGVPTGADGPGEAWADERPGCGGALR
jgi:hypothetical protein